jgi:RimJ/RimL family protein N-acetyltransferase
MQNFEIRELTPEDAEQFLAMMKKAGGETENLLVDENGMKLSAEEERKWLQSVHEKPRSVIYGVFDQDKLIGNCGVSAMPGRLSHRAELAICVLKEYWNRGIVSLMMEHLIAYARNHGIKIINLDVRSDNAGAIHLYEKYGFKRIGRFPAYFKIGSCYYDFDLMVLDLRK